MGEPMNYYHLGLAFHIIQFKYSLYSLVTRYGYNIIESPTLQIKTDEMKSIVGPQINGNYKRSMQYLLLISVILRWWLVIKGGLYFLPDELRYEYSRSAVKLLFQGNSYEAFRLILERPDHIGFKMFGMIPSFFEYLVGFDYPIIAGLLFSLFSVLNIYLIYRLAIRNQSDQKEAFIAAFIALSVSTLFYFSRHLQPYDLALSFGLLSLYVGIKKKPNYLDTITCSLLGFMAFITYNGYWAFVGYSIIVHILHKSHSVYDVGKRALISIITFVILILSLIAIGNIYRFNILDMYKSFSLTVTQGLFSEGWWLPFEYLWHSEKLIFLLLVGLFIYSVLAIDKIELKRIYIWIGGILFIYLCLFIPSIVFHRFVVYGRTTRQIIPFLILVGAFSLRKIEKHEEWGRKMLALFIFMIISQAGYNFYQSFILVYPIQFYQSAKSQYPDFQLSHASMDYKYPSICRSNNYLSVNIKYIYPYPEIPPEISSDLLYSASHPLNFSPYLYEGFSPSQRKSFRSAEPKMEIYRIQEDYEDAKIIQDIPRCEP